MPPVAPMLAKPIENIPTGPFSFEPKWDGFRSIVFRDGEEVEIGSRNERPMTRYFPEVVDAIKANLPERCVVDGEVVVPDPAGRRLEFETLQQRIHPANSRVRLLAERTPACWPWAIVTTRGNRSRGAVARSSNPSPARPRRSTSRPRPPTETWPTGGSARSKVRASTA